jgi:hypothetical protein
MVSSTGDGPDGAAEAVPASPSAADANAPAAREVKRIFFMVVPFLCSVTHDGYLLLAFVRHSLQRPLAISAPIRPEGAIVALPADLVVSQGATVKPKKTVGSGSAITWLTNAPTRLLR